MINYLKRDFCKLPVTKSDAASKSLKLSRFLVLGGTGISLAIHLNNRQLIVECEANRLKGTFDIMQSLRFKSITFFYLSFRY